MNYSDVEDVKFVINFDYPNNSEDYVHRIGRTGRSNNTGTAYTLFTYQNASKANDLIQVLKEANQVTILHTTSEMCPLTIAHQLLLIGINFFSSLFSFSFSNLGGQSKIIRIGKDEFTWQQS